MFSEQPPRGTELLGPARQPRAYDTVTHTWMASNAPEDGTLPVRASDGARTQSQTAHTRPAALLARAGMALGTTTVASRHITVTRRHP